MLDLPRASCRFALGLVVLALGCTQSAPPAVAPHEDSSDDAAAEPEAWSESAADGASAPSAAAPPGVETPPDATSSVTPAAKPTASGNAAPHAARDTRGKEQIQQVMVANRDKVRACYDAALPQNPGIHGGLVLDFVLDPRGHVKQAEVNWSASDLHVPELDTCALDALRSFEFPPSSRGLESKVSYPFNFNPPRTDPPPKKP